MNFKHFIIISTSLFLVVIFTLSFTYPLLNDTYFHMSVGREVFETQKIPTQDNFVYSEKDITYTSTEWLTGLLFYLAYDKWQETGLHLIRIIAIVATLFFVVKSLRLFTNNYLTIATLILFLGLVMFKRFNARPEIISYAILSLINYVCLTFYFKGKIPKSIYALPPLFLLWPNIHGFAPIGTALMGFYSFVILLKNKLMLLSREGKIFIGIFILSTFLAVIQWERFFFFTHAGNFSEFITEWVSLARRISPLPTDPISDSMTFDIISYLVIFPLYILALIFLIRGEKNKTLWLVSIFYLVLLAAAIKYGRLIQPMMLLSLPMIFLAFKKAFRLLNAKYLIPLGFTALIAYCLLSFGAGRVILGTRQNIESPYGPRLKTVEFIDSYLDSKRIFTMGRWSDFLVWHLPNVKTFNSVMHQYRSLEGFEDEAKLHDPKTNPRELLEKYSIDTIINTSRNNKFISVTSVQDLSNWELVFIDTKSEVWARKDIIRKKPIDLSLVNPESTRSADLDPAEISQLENLLAFDPTNDFALRRIIIYSYNEKGQRKEAYMMAKKARDILPKDPYFSYMLSAFSIDLGRCQDAIGFAKEADKKSKHNPEIKKLTQPLIDRCR